METAWQAWLKYQPCSFCGCESGSIVDHCKGSTFKHQKRMIGEIFCNSKCFKCDQVVTIGTRKDLFEKYGKTDSEATLIQLDQYYDETGIRFEVADELVIYDVYSVNEEVTNWMEVL